MTANPPFYGFSHYAITLGPPEDPQEVPGISSLSLVSVIIRHRIAIAIGHTHHHRQLAVDISIFIAISILPSPLLILYVFTISSDSSWDVLRFYRNGIQFAYNEVEHTEESYTYSTITLVGALVIDDLRIWNW